MEEPVVNTAVARFFITMEKENAYSMFGYRIRFIPGKKVPYKDKSKDKINCRTDIGQLEMKNVNYRYE